MARTPITLAAAVPLAALVARFEGGSPIDPLPYLLRWDRYGATRSTRSP